MFLQFLFRLGLELILAVNDPTITKVFMLLFEKSPKVIWLSSWGENVLTFHYTIYKDQFLMDYNSKCER